MDKKFCFYSFFLFLLLVVSIFTYQSHQQTSPTFSGWQSYTNKEYGFLVSYPSIITPKIIPTDTSLFFVNFKNEVDQKTIWFSVQVDKNTLEEAVNFVRSQTEGHLPVILSKKFGITHAGFPGFRLEYTPDSSNVNQSLTYVLIKKKAYIYTISASSKDISQILSTFKFIDDKSVCVPTYQVEVNSTELTAKQNYSMRCTEQRSEKDCLSIDFYNRKADDFNIPDKIPDCIWKNPIK